MAERCVSGMDAVEYFMSLPVPEGKQNLRDRALNRIKYEVAKGYGVRLKVIKAVYKGHADVKNCGNCGSGISEAWFNYCPNCGFAILKNDYTEKCLKERKEENHQMDIEEWLKMEGDNAEYG